LPGIFIARHKALYLVFLPKSTFFSLKTDLPQCEPFEKYVVCYMATELGSLPYHLTLEQNPIEITAATY
jgi:hypothetical protein